MRMLKVCVCALYYYRRPTCTVCAYLQYSMHYVYVGVGVGMCIVMHYIHISVCMHVYVSVSVSFVIQYLDAERERVR